MNKHAETAIKALSMYLGDDFQRAQAAFKRFTPEQMQDQHGESGKTRQQILDDYKAHQDQVTAAITWVKSVGA
jgi:hypothetical protein